MSKAGRADLHRRGANDHVLENIFSRFDPTKTNDRNLDGPAGFIHQPQSDWFYRRARESPSHPPKPRFSCLNIDTHGLVGVSNRQGISPGSLCRSGDSGDICNIRREFDPKRATGLAPGSTYHFRNHLGVAPELQAAVSRVWTGNIEFVGG